MKKAIIPFLLIVLVLVISIGKYQEKVRISKYKNENITTENIAGTTDIEVEQQIYSNDYIYVSAFQDTIDVYVKGSNQEGNHYIGYHVMNLKKEIDKNENSSNYDVWKLHGTNEYMRTNSDNFEKTLNVVNKGEWDLALFEKGANDFVGGSLHGDEITTSFELFVDNNRIDMNNESLSQEVQELKFIVVSDLYRDNTISDGLEKIATHNKVYIFNKDGLTVTQEILFNEPLELKKSYLAMLPILRNSEGKSGSQVTDTVITNYDNKEYIVSEAGFNIPELRNVDADKVEIWSEESGISAIVEIIDRTQLDIPHSFTLSSSDLYNKLYFSFVEDGHSTTENEIWRQTTHYKIDTIN